MKFATKLAKLGKANNINCCQIQTNPTIFNVFLKGDKTEQKQLKYWDKNYELGKVKNLYNYAEMIAINANFALARIGSNISIIKVEYGS